MFTFRDTYIGYKNATLYPSRENNSWIVSRFTKYGMLHVDPIAQIWPSPFAAGLRRETLHDCCMDAVH